MSDHTHDDAAAPDEQILAQRLREAREYLGLSQEQVAKVLAVPRASISALENAKRKVSTTELKKLAQLYRLPVSHFLGDSETDTAVETEDETIRALFRATHELSDTDREQVLRFAQFLRHAGKVPRG